MKRLKYAHLLSVNNIIIAAVIIIIASLITSNQVTTKKLNSESLEFTPHMPYSYGIDCRKPKSNEEKSLCVQQASTDVNIEVARWTRFQAAVGTVGIISFFFTAWAALSSAISASASRESVRISQLAFTQDQRPWIYMKHSGPSPISISANVLNIELPVEVSNFGKTPALDMVVRAIKFDATTINSYIDFAAEAARATKEEARNIKVYDPPCFPNITNEKALHISHSFSRAEIEKRHKTFGVDYLIIAAYRGNSIEDYYCTVSMFSIWFKDVFTYSSRQVEVPRSFFDTINLPGSNIVL